MLRGLVVSTVGVSRCDSWRACPHVRGAGANPLRERLPGSRRPADASMLRLLVLRLRGVRHDAHGSAPCGRQRTRAARARRHRTAPRRLPVHAGRLSRRVPGRDDRRGPVWSPAPAPSILRNRRDHSARWQIPEVVGNGFARSILDLPGDGPCPIPRWSRADRIGISVIRTTWACSANWWVSRCWLAHPSPGRSGLCCSSR